MSKHPLVGKTIAQVDDSDDVLVVTFTDGSCIRIAGTYDLGAVIEYE